MFTAKNKVRMHDTDMAGILYFANQFRFVHDAFEDFVEMEGITFQQVLQKEDFLFVIVHVEADYLGHLTIGDNLDIHVSVENIGNSAFTILYYIYKKNGFLVGKAKTVHVTLDKATRKKMPIPEHLKILLQKHLV